MTEKMRIIYEKDLLELLESHYRLAALERGGVDNWEWYSDSCADFINEYMRDIEFEDVEDAEIEDFGFADIAKDMIGQYPFISLYLRGKYIYPCHRFRIKEALENIKDIVYNNTAEWNSYGCCSNCGYNAKHLDVTEYCPSCGKKMVNT